MRIIKLPNCSQFKYLENVYFKISDILLPTSYNQYDQLLLPLRWVSVVPTTTTILPGIFCIHLDSSIIVWQDLLSKYICMEQLGASCLGSKDQTKPWPILRYVLSTIHNISRCFSWNYPIHQFTNWNVRSMMARLYHSIKTVWAIS